MASKLPPRNLALLTAMARRGMNGQLLAEHTGVHYSTISKIVNGRVNPQRETRRKIADALKTSQCEIFGGAAA